MKSVRLEEIVKKIMTLSWLVIQFGIIKDGEVLKPNSLFLHLVLL